MAQQVIDFTDSAPHLAGKVGIGTWSTTARFRNLKVTSLTGDVLFEGLPQALGQESTALHWTKFGSGKCYITCWQRRQQSMQPAHGGRHGRDGHRTAAVSHLRSGETYVGSLFARGTAPAGLIVRLQ